MLEFSSTESCTTSNTSTPLVGFSSNDSSCDGNVALMNDFESTGGCSGQGPQGPDGFSAYQIAVFNGFVGTEEEWLASLVGAPGQGVPVGGTAGQILTKIDSTNYNTFWQDNYADWTSVVKHIVKNDGTGLILKGTPVYVTGSNGTNMLVGKASNISEATSSKTMGLMQTDITTTGGTQTGFVITEGLLAGLNTAGRTAGEPIWLGPNGTLIYGLINKPYAPAHLVFIGIVTKVSAGNGEVFVKIQNGFELKEIHDVDVITTTPVNGDVLGFNGSLWVNKTIPNWLGYTPFNLPSLTSGSVLFSNGTTLAQDNSNFFWDNVNKRLGIGTVSPIYNLDVNGTSRFVGNLQFELGIRDNRSNTIITQSLSSLLSNRSLTIGNATYSSIIFPNGNVGIGTSTPGELLEIYSGNIRLRQGYKYAWRNSGAVDDAYISSTSTSMSFNVYSGSFNFISSAGSGNVGIGTANPGNKLSIVGAATSGDDTIPILGANGGKFSILNGGGSGYYGLLGGVIGTGQAFLQVQRVDGTATPYNLLLQPNGGNIGVGTLSPGGTLDVAGALSNNKSFIRVTNTDTANYITIGAGIPTITNAGMNFTLDGISKMVISSAGNLGIGETSPLTTLDIRTSLNTTITPLSSVPNASTTVLIGNTGTNGVLAIGHNNTGKPWLQGRSRLAGAAAEDILINPLGGNVGIGTTTPSAKLDVVGDYYSSSGHIGLGSQDSRFWIFVDKTITVDTLNYGFYDQIRLDTSSNAINTAQVGVFGKTYFQNGSNALSLATGLYGEVQRGNTATGTLAIAYGVQAYVHNDVAGEITNAYGIRSLVSTAVGTIANGYSLYLESAGSNRPTNSWGVYQADTLSKNYFAGNVGIGTTTPTAKLDILDTVLAGSAALAGSVLNIAQTWNTTGVPTALLLNVTDTASNGYSKLFDFQVGGLSQLTLFKDGRVQMKSNTALNSAGNSVILRTNLGGGSGYNVDVASYNTFNTSNSPQGFISLGGSIAYPLGTGVFKGINVTYTINNPGVQTGTATGIFLNATETALNGMVHNLMDLQRGGVSKFRVSSAGTLVAASSLVSAGNIQSGTGNYIQLGSGVTKIWSPSDGVLQLTDTAATSFSRLQLGGTTSSYPAIKRNGAQLDFRLADDSGYCAISAAQAVFTNTFVSILFSPSYYESTGVKQWLSVANTTAACSFKTTSLFADSGTINASARVQIDSTTQGFLPPRMTTAQKVGIATPATGLVVFDTDLGKLCVFAVTWQTITSV